MIRPLLFWLVCLSSLSSWGAFSNYNTVVIGDRSSGMGGAATSLSGDASADAFYNPAALARLTGEAQSGTVGTYQKSDTEYGNISDARAAALRANLGYFRAISAASGHIVKVGDNYLGLSIVVPDFDTFQGELSSDGTSSSSMTFTDESLWVGGAVARRLGAQDTIGLTTYYTARNASRTTMEKLFPTSDNAIIINEDRSVKSNSIVFILGYQKQINDNWTYGVSLRPTAIRVGGFGTYSYSRVEANPFKADPPTNLSRLSARTEIPAKLAMGVSYSVPRSFTVAFDIVNYAPAEYDDFEDTRYADHIKHVSTTNYMLGTEVYLLEWLKVRGGVYTNYSSHPTPDEGFGRRQGDHVDMTGFSANISATRKNASYTFGGYYTGGSGVSLQKSNDNLKGTVRSEQVFTMLVGFSHTF